MGNRNDDQEELASPLGLPPDLNSIVDDDWEAEIPTLPIENQSSIANVKWPSDFNDSGNTPVIEGYQIDRKLGQGGMGSVYLATDKNLMRQVAIKIVSQSFQENSARLDRFESEIQTLAALKHPYIAQLYSAGSCQDLPYFVMEFVDGETLESYAREPLKPQQAATIVSQLCEAVAYCHENGVLHRDLKPANVLLDENHQAKIADFGLAKTLDTDTSNTRTGEILGTPTYMAPEQASGVVKSFTAACDIYALGAILYRLLTGRPPFVAADPVQVVMQVLADDPIPPGRLVGNVPYDLQTICLKCLEKKPSRRYQSANELRDDLQCYLAGKPISARPSGVFEKSAKWVNRNRIKALLISSLCVLAIAALFGLSWHNQVLSNELAKTKRLADHGSELSNWLVSDHLSSLSQIAGTTKPRHEVTTRVRDFLDASYADIPPDPKYTRRLGVSYVRLAAIAGGEDQNNLGDHKQAEACYLRALELYEQALEKDEKDALSRQLRVSALMALSATYMELKQPDKSQHYFELANESSDDLDTSDWKAQFLQIRMQGQEAQLLMSRNDFDAALVCWDGFGELLESVHPDAQQNELEHQQVFLETNRGECLANLGRNADAEAAFRKANEIVERAALENPDNVLFQQRWGSSLELLGNHLFAQEKTSDAMVCLTKARDICKEIVEADEESVRSAMALASKFTNISGLHFYLQEIPAADEAIQKSIKIYQSLRDRNQLGLTGKRQLAICMHSQANILMLSGDNDGAKDLYNEHETLCLGLITTDRDSIPELTQLAENHFQQSLLLLSTWMEDGFDVETARQSQEYKDIVGHLDQSDDFFARIAKAGKLNVNQQAFRDRIVDVRKLIEDAINQLMDAEETEDSAIF